MSGVVAGVITQLLHYKVFTLKMWQGDAVD